MYPRRPGINGSAFSSEPKVDYYYLRLKGFSKEEIDNFTASDLKAIDKARDIDLYALSNALYSVVDYKILMESKPTNKKGKIDNAKKNELHAHAQKLRAIMTTPNYQPPKEPTKEEHEYYDHLVRQIIAEKKARKKSKK